MKINRRTARAVDIFRWLRNHDKDADLSMDLVHSITYEANLAPTARLLFLHLKSLGEEVLSTNEDLADALSLTLAEVESSIFELKENGKIKVQCDGITRVIHCTGFGWIRSFSEASKFLNVDPETVSALVTQGTLMKTGENFLTRTLLWAKRYNILQRERARRNLRRYLKMNEILTTAA